MAGGKDVVIRAAIEGGPVIVKTLKDLQAELDKIQKSGSAKMGAGLEGIAPSADKATAALNKTAAATKLTAQQSTQLAYQLNDVAVQLAGGQNPFLVLLQQGSQITPLFGGIIGTLARLGPTIAGIGATIGPVLAALKGASIGNEAAKSIAEIGREATKAGLPVKQLEGYIGALSGKGVDQKEVATSFQNLRKQAFASRDAWREAQRAFNEKVKEAAPGEQYKIDPVKGPNDVFKKLGLDLRNFNGDVESVLRQLQTNFGKLGSQLQRNEFARIVEDSFGRPIAELVRKAPADVAKINAAFASIVPPLSQNQINIAERVSAQSDIISKIYADLGKQVDAAFIPVADAFNKFKFNLITSGDNLKTFMDFVKSLATTMADFWKILSGDQVAAKNSPWVNTFVSTFKVAYESLSAFKDLAIIAFETIKRDSLGIQAIWLQMPSIFSKRGENWAKDVETNKNAIIAAQKAIDKAGENLAVKGDNIVGILSGKPTAPANRIADTQNEGKQATDAQNESLRFQTQALNEATDATKKYTDATAASNAERKRDPRLGNAGYGFGKEAQYVNDPKANPDYYRSDAEYAAIAERQRQEMAARANAMRQEFINNGGDARSLNANDQVLAYQQATQAAQQLSATTSEIASNSNSSSQSWTTVQSSTAAVRDTLSGIQPPDLSNLLSQLARASEYAQKIAASINSNSPMPSSSAFQASSTGFASGGFVSGPGTSTSDSIPAWLSSGEYVVRAAAVKRYGVGLMHAINGMAAPRRGFGFAAGGLVPPSSVAMAGGSSGGRGLTLVLDGKSFGGMSGSNDAMDALERYAIARRISSTTKRTPSRVG